MYFFHLSFLGHISKYLDPSYYCPLDFFQFSTSPFNCGAPKWIQYSRRVISLLLCYIHITLVIIHLRRKFVLLAMASIDSLSLWLDHSVLCSCLFSQGIAHHSPLCFCTWFFLLMVILCTWTYQISCWLGLFVQLSRPFLILSLPFKGVAASFNLWSFAESKTEFFWLVFKKLGQRCSFRGD